MNYGALIHRIRECGYTIPDVAKQIGISTTSLSLKLNNHSQFKQSEILGIVKVLELDMSEIGFFFFTPKFNVH